MDKSRACVSNQPHQFFVGLLFAFLLSACGSGGGGGASPPTVLPGDDPLYPEQWNLRNTGQRGADNVPGKAGEDINVEPAWATYKGNGIRIAIVDDGLEVVHEDLAANVAAIGLSYNYVTGGTDPSNDPGDLFSGHGTAVAGIAAARDMNGLGGRGVAPRASLVGYNLLQNISLSNEADAMMRGAPDVHVSSNSWGAPDLRGSLDASNSLWRAAIDYGVTSGRGGKGTVYTFAAGNGAPIDNSNYDGQANYRNVIAVAAVNDQGQQSSYSEPGANIWISAPGGEFCDSHAIIATDRTGDAGINPQFGTADYVNQNYTKCMNGTSSAVPQITGVVALILQANPNLGWRDVRLILAQSARKNDPADAGWGVTGASNVYFNHKYGFGVVDAGAAVALAQGWVNVGAQKTFAATAASGVPAAIPDDDPTGVSSTINVADSGISNIEFIEIIFSAADHPYEGDLEIALTSPSGTVSQLAETHACLGANQEMVNPCPTHYSGWVFGSARHLGESADGTWTLTVKDRWALDTGTFQSWSLRFYGR